GLKHDRQVFCLLNASDVRNLCSVVARNAIWVLDVANARRPLDLAVEHDCKLLERIDVIPADAVMHDPSALDEPLRDVLEPLRAPVGELHAHDWLAVVEV